MIFLLDATSPLDQDCDKGSALYFSPFIFTANLNPTFYYNGPCITESRRSIPARKA